MLFQRVELHQNFLQLRSEQTQIPPDRFVQMPDRKISPFWIRG